MAITVGAMARNCASVALQIGENTLTISYRPSMITDELIARIDGGMAERNNALASIITAWDFFEDAEQTIMVPITAARMESIDIGLKAQISFAILRDMRPNLAKPQ